MAAAGLLQQHQLTPLLLGAANDDYARVGTGIRAATARAGPLLLARLPTAAIASTFPGTRLPRAPSRHPSFLQPASL